MALNLLPVNLLSTDQALTNNCYVHPSGFAKLAEMADLDAEAAAKGQGVLCAVNEAVFWIKPNDRFMPDNIGCGMAQRVAGRMTLSNPVPISPFIPPRKDFPTAMMQFELELAKAPAEGEVSLDASEVAKWLNDSFHNHVFKIGQQFAGEFKGWKTPLILRITVRGFDYLDLSNGKSASAAGGEGEDGAAFGSVKFGQFLRTTEVQLKKKAGTPIKLTGSSSSKGSRLFEKGFNFEALGIGGLNKEFADIFRRAFASRVMPPDILKKMGQHHVRGMLLYGPPGCGKTLIARQIGKALHSHPPKIVNGPEILNKYVGQSEENIRALFADAEKEQSERGDDSELHIIIFDEFDAIAKSRGTANNGTGVNDSIVNQLLSKIDGVEALNNILLIGMTNRKDMIDDAILRPGRLEVHVEIGLPDEEGRVQILNIHTAEMRKNGILGADVSIPDIASRTKNYTGAEIEGLVKAACSYVFARQIDLNDLSKLKDPSALQVTREDFDRALSETTPAFGVKEDELVQTCAGGIINTGPEFERVQTTLQRLAQQVATSDRTPLVSVVLAGASGTGKSALAARLAIDSGFPFVKRISGESLLRYHESGKADAIAKVFNDAYKSPLSLIILDDLERLMEYVAVGPRFSNSVLQTLLVLCKALPPPGRKLFIIATTAIPDLLEQMELFNSFQLVLPVPQLTDHEQYVTVLKAAAKMSDSDAEASAKHLEHKPLGVKKLLAMIEMARQDLTDANECLPYDKFLESLVEWGI